MLDRKNIIVAVVIMILTFLISVFGYDSNLHYLFVQAHYIFIILLALYYRKILFLVLSYLVVSHLIIDYIEVGRVPVQAITESFVQIMTAVFLYILVIERERTNERYKNVIEGAKIGTWEWDMQKGTSTYNKRYAEILGYRLDELDQDRTIVRKRLLHPEDYEKTEAKIAEVRTEKGVHYSAVVRMRHKEGHDVYVKESGDVIQRNIRNQPVLMVGTISDITDEVRLQQELEQSYDMMRQVIEHNKSAVAVHDKDLNYLFVSQRYLDEYEVKDQDVIGKHHYKVLPDLPEKWRAVHRRVLKGEVVRADRDVYKRNDGTTDYTRWECRPLYGANDSIEGLIVYTEIITDQIKRERMLESSQDLLEATLNKIPIGIAIHASWPKIDIVYMNDLYPKLLGTNRKTLEHARSLFEVVIEDEQQRQAFLTSVEAKIQAGNNERMAFRHIPIKKGHEVQHHITVFVDWIDESNVYVVSVFDEKNMPRDA